MSDLSSSAEIMHNGLQSLRTILDSFLQFLLQFEQEKTIYMHRDAVERVYHTDAFFSDRSDKVRKIMNDVLVPAIKEGKAVPDDFERISKTIDLLEREGMHAEESFEKIKAVINRSDMYGKTKDDLLSLFQNALVKIDPPQYLTVNAETYRKVESMLKENGLLGLSYQNATTDKSVKNEEYNIFTMNGITPIELNDGTFQLYTLGDDRIRALEKIVNLALVENRCEPWVTKSEYDAMRRVRAGVRKHVADIVIPNVSPEYAEKMQLLSYDTKSSVIFIKVKRENGNYDLYADAGDQSPDKAVNESGKIYREFCKLNALAKISLSGAYGKYESRHMRYLLSREQKIDDLIKQGVESPVSSVTIPFVREYKNENGDIIPLIKGRIEISKNSVILYDASGKSQNPIYRNGRSDKEYADYIRRIVGKESDNFKDAAIIQQNAIDPLENRYRQYKNAAAVLRNEYADMILNVCSDPNNKDNIRILNEKENELKEAAVNSRNSTGKKQNGPTPEEIQYEEFLYIKDHIEKDVQNVYGRSYRFPDSRKLQICLDAVIGVNYIHNDVWRSSVRSNERDEVRGTHEFINYMCDHSHDIDRELGALGIPAELTPHHASEKVEDPLNMAEPYETEQILDTMNRLYVNVMENSCIHEDGEIMKTVWNVEKDDEGYPTANGVSEINEKINVIVDRAKESFNDVRLFSQEIENDLDYSFSAALSGDNLSEKMDILHDRYKENILDQHQDEDRVTEKRESVHETSYEKSGD